MSQISVQSTAENCFPEFLLVLFIEYSCHYKWLSFLHCKGSVNMENLEVVRDISHQNTTEWTIQIIMVIRENIINEGSRTASDSCRTGNQWKKLITVHNIHKCICQVMCLRIKQVNIVVPHQIYQLIFHTQLFLYTCKCCVKIHHICVWNSIYNSNYYIFLGIHTFFIYFNKKWILYTHWKWLNHCVQYCTESQSLLYK